MKQFDAGKFGKTVLWIAVAVAISVFLGAPLVGSLIGALAMLVVLAFCGFYKGGSTTE